MFGGGGRRSGVRHVRTGDPLRIAPTDESVDWSLSLGRPIGYGMAAVDETVYAVAMPDDGPQRLVAVA